MDPSELAIADQLVAIHRDWLPKMVDHLRDHVVSGDRPRTTFMLLLELWNVEQHQLACMLAATMVELAEREVLAGR